MAPQIHRNREEKVAGPAHCISSRAIKLRGGPGRNGRMHPAIPTIEQITASIVSTVSIHSVSILYRQVPEIGVAPFCIGADPFRAKIIKNH